MRGPKRNRGGDSNDDDSDTTASDCEADELYDVVPGSAAGGRCFAAPPSKRRKLMKAPVLKYDVTDSALEIHTLPIGQGDCTIIYCPNKDYAILFDCGSSQGNTLPLDGIRRYYRHVKKMTIIISHGHKDHYKFIPALFDTDNSRYLSMINEVIVGGKESDYSNNLIKKWLQIEKKSSIFVQKLYKEQL